NVDVAHHCPTAQGIANISTHDLESPSLRFNRVEPSPRVERVVLDKSANLVARAREQLNEM
ncbi:MAG: hypothetical protein U0269_06545, partial [Polyangiales bacterium]